MKTGFLAAVLCCGLAAGAAAADDSSERYVLRVRGGEGAVVAADHGLTVIQALRPPSLFLVGAPAGAALRELELRLRADLRVVGLERRRGAHTPEGEAVGMDAPAVPLRSLANRSGANFGGSHAWVGYLDQPALGVIGWAAGSRGRGRAPLQGAGIVAVIDTGIDPNHPVLAPVLLPGYDFTRDAAGPASEWGELDASVATLLETPTAQLEGALPSGVRPVALSASVAAILDESTARELGGARVPAAFGHGTMVAGLIHLVAPEARILPLKAFSADGSSNTADIVRAVYYAVDHGASVINMSFSLEAFSDELLKAINYATRSGVVCISSVGNGGKEVLRYPAALANVIGVASTTLEDARAPFSNYGIDVVRVAAPGVSLITTYPGGRYAVVSGTSYSAALVSGIAALIVEAREYDTDFHRTLDALAHGTFLSVDMGYGRVRVPEALAAARRRQR